MAIKQIKGDFEFPPSFGFSKSAARPTAKPQAKAMGGTVKKFALGGNTGEPTAAYNAPPNLTAGMRTPIPTLGRDLPNIGVGGGPTTGTGPVPSPGIGGGALGPPTTGVPGSGVPGGPMPLPRMGMQSGAEQMGQKWNPSARAMMKGGGKVTKKAKGGAVRRANGGSVATPRAIDWDNPEAVNARGEARDVLDRGGDVSPYTVGVLKSTRADPLRDFKQNTQQDALDRDRRQFRDNGGVEKAKGGAVNRTSRKRKG